MHSHSVRNAAPDAEDRTKSIPMLRAYPGQAGLDAGRGQMGAAVKCTTDDGRLVGRARGLAVVLRPSTATGFRPRFRGAAPPDAAAARATIRPILDPEYLERADRRGAEG